MDNINKNTLGYLIREKRGNRSLRSFAIKCGISHTYIDNIEKGSDPRTGKKVNITIEMLQKLSPILNISIETLLYISLEINNEKTDLQKIIDQLSPRQIILLTEYAKGMIEAAEEMANIGKKHA